jgi:hypothetical protein
MLEIHPRVKVDQGLYAQPQSMAFVFTESLNGRNELQITSLCLLIFSSVSVRIALHTGEPLNSRCIPIHIRSMLVAITMITNYSLQNPHVRHQKWFIKLLLGNATIWSIRKHMCNVACTQHSTPHTHTHTHRTLPFPKATTTTTTTTTTKITTNLHLPHPICHLS